MPVKPVVAIDIDGTIGNYHDHFAAMCCGYWGISLPRSAHWDGYGEFEDWIGVTKDQYREAKLAYRQGGYKRTMQVYYGAHSLLRNIRRAGAELWLVTTRPWLRLDNIDPDTRWWVSFNGLEFDHLLYGNDEKYLRLIEQVDAQRIVAVLDDLPEQFDIATELGLPIYQRKNEHNKYPKCQRSPSCDLVEFANVVTVKILEWSNDD
jgi:hypothetical protein